MKLAGKNRAAGKFYDKGLFFNCVQCDYCCGEEPGFVFLSYGDLTALCRETGLERDDFLKKYCDKIDTGFVTRISLKEKERHDCIFLERGKGCSVYNARPRQCRTYPFWASVLESEKSWNQESRYCPGINREADGKRVPASVIEELSKDRLDDPLITVEEN